MVLAPAVARVRPSGLNTTKITELVLVNVAVGMGRVESMMLHSRTLLSSLLSLLSLIVTKVCPSGLNAVPSTGGGRVAVRVG